MLQRLIFLHINAVADAGSTDGYSPHGNNNDIVT